MPSNLTDEILVPFLKKRLDEHGSDEVLRRAFSFIEELASDLEAEIRDVGQEVVNCLAPGTGPGGGLTQHPYSDFGPEPRLSVLSSAIPASNFLRQQIAASGGG